MTEKESRTRNWAFPAGTTPSGWEPHELQDIVDRWAAVGISANGWNVRGLVANAVLRATGLDVRDLRLLCNMAFRLVPANLPAGILTVKIVPDASLPVPALLREGSPLLLHVRLPEGDGGAKAVGGALLASSLAAALADRAGLFPAGQRTPVLLRLFLTLFTRTSTLLFPPSEEEADRAFRNLHGWSGEPAGEIRAKCLALCRTEAWSRYRERAERARVYLYAKAFADLPPAEQRATLRAGLIAWYDFLTFGLLRRLGVGGSNPYTEPARLVLRGWVGDARTGRIRAATRVKRALGQKGFFHGVEAFWSGWNPRLTRITVRPWYRLHGGDRRPFRATLSTFLFSALVLHPLWLTLTLCGAAAVAKAAGVAWVDETGFTHPAVWWAHGLALGFYALFGLSIGAVKLFRRKRPA